MKTRYNEHPNEVTIRDLGEYWEIEIALNATEKTETYAEGEPPWHGWEADGAHFAELKTAIDPDDVRMNPEKYLNYITLSQRDAIRNTYIDAIQKWMDKEAASHGYDNILSAASYAGDADPKYAAEGEACKAWRSKVWRKALDYSEAVMRGDAALVSVQAFIDSMPRLIWPQ